MLEKTKEFAKKPSITPLTLIFLIVSIAIDIYVSYDNAYLTVLQVSIVILLVLSGVKMTDIKAVMLRLRTVLEDPKTSLRQKIAKVFDIVITGCAVLGQLHEEALQYPIEDFIKEAREEGSEN
jgi:hypothetical protein